MPKARDERPLDRALQALTDAALELLGADSSIAVVWDDRGKIGVIRAGSGRGARLVGAVVGRPDAAPETASLVRVPIDGFLPARVLVTASWRTPRTRAALERAEATLRALTRLVERSSRAELDDARLHEHNRNLLTERFLEQLFEALPIGVGVADPATGEMLSVNPAFAALVGHEPDEMTGIRPPYPWWPEAPALDAAAEPCLREALFRRRDGRLVPVEVVPFLVSEASGRPAASVTLITDRSERRRFEQQMVQSGRLAAIGELAAGVAHEINNPLFAILGLVEFLLKEVEEGTKPHDRLRLIQRTGLEIKDVVRALLDFARERSDELEAVSLPDVLAQTVDLVRRTTLRKELELVERYAPGDTVVYASAGQVKQVVLNLVTNAQQAMGDTGTIAVELTRENGNAAVRVSDTGPGIAPEVFDRIFDPFFTTKREIGGTGLGLPLSQSIVDAHGGTLVAASPPGGGAEFTFTLPLVRREEAPAS